MLVRTPVCSSYVTPPLGVAFRCHLPTFTGCQTVRYRVQEFHYLWASPFEAFTIIGLLGSLVGKWALPAAGIVAAIIFIQYFFGWQIAMNKHKNSHNVNERCARWPFLGCTAFGCLFC